MKTVDEFYQDLLNANQSWVTPILKKFDSECLSSFYFRVEVKNFDAINSVPCLRIINVLRNKKTSRTSSFTIIFEILQ